MVLTLFLFRKDLEVYPNPSYGNYTIKLPQGISNGKIIVTNINGQIILNQEIQNHTYIKEIDITSFPSGRYNIDVYPDDNPERIFYGVQIVKI